MGSERQDREQTRALGSRNAWADLVAELRGSRELVSCVRQDEASHRATDRRLPATDDLPPGPWVCGICHPMPPELELEAERREPPPEAIA